MPVVYRCKHCGFVLYVFPFVGYNSYGLPTPSEIASWYGGVCPNCGHLLTTPTERDVVIEPTGLRQGLERVLELKPFMARKTYEEISALLSSHWLVHVESRHKIQLYTKRRSPRPERGGHP